MAYYNPAQGQPQIQYQGQPHIQFQGQPQVQYQGQPQVQYQGQPHFQYQVQPQVQYPGPIVYHAAPAVTYHQAGIQLYGPHYEKEQSVGLGATQIILACISITAGIMAIVYGAELYYVGIGIWAGAFYLAAGSVAIAAGKDATNSLIKATLVCSVFDILLGFAQLTTTAIAVAEEIDGYYNYYSDWLVGCITANSMMIGVASLEIIFGIWLTAISRLAIKKGSKAQVATMPVAYATHQPETVFIQASPASQPQPPPYNVQQQYPSTSNPPQMMYVGVHQAPLTTVQF